jgi:hypothetical protein
VASVQLTSAKGSAGDKLRLGSWIEVQLLGEDDKPIAGEAVSIVLPGGTTMTGTLDESGLLRIDDVPPGVCHVSFPALDRSAWTAIETSGGNKESASSGDAQPGRAA